MSEARPVLVLAGSMDLALDASQVAGVILAADWTGPAPVDPWARLGLSALPGRAGGDGEARVVLLKGGGQLLTRGEVAVSEAEPLALPEVLARRVAPGVAGICLPEGRRPMLLLDPVALGPGA